jgi:hypothetical protein
VRQAWREQGIWKASWGDRIVRRVRAGRRPRLHRKPIMERDHPDDDPGLYVFSALYSLKDADRWPHDERTVGERLECLAYEERVFGETGQFYLVEEHKITDKAGGGWAPARVEEHFRKRREELQREGKELSALAPAKLAERQQEMDASRPIHMFLFQVRKEVARLQSKPVDGGNDASLDARAYAAVRASWEQRGIWSP